VIVVVVVVVVAAHLPSSIPTPSRQTFAVGPAAALGILAVPALEMRQASALEVENWQKNSGKCKSHMFF